MKNKFVLLLILVAWFYNRPIGPTVSRDIELTDLSTNSLRRHSSSPTRTPEQRRHIIRIIMDKAKDTKEAYIAAGGSVVVAVVAGTVALLIHFL